MGSFNLEKGIKLRDIRATTLRSTDVEKGRIVKSNFKKKTVQ